MSQGERIELIREIVMLLQMQENSKGKMFDNEMIDAMKTVLRKSFAMAVQ